MAPTDAARASAPIGIFDSGFGGLTVAREVMRLLPDERIVYLGDSARCPYGPRDQEEVRGFVFEICERLVERGVKLIVIACNTATAAGLTAARERFDVPILGVVEPGARAAQAATRNGLVGVIATAGTVESGAYTDAIRSLDPAITVFSTATPRFVEIAEQGIRMAQGPIESYTSLASKVYIRPAFQEIARDYLEPLRRCDVDTLVLGCTHFPLLKTLIGGVMGRDVVLISSAKETARDVRATLAVMGLLNPGNASVASADTDEATAFALDENKREGGSGDVSVGLSGSGSGSATGAGLQLPVHEFFTTGDDTAEFSDFGQRVLGIPLGEVRHIDL